jgi:hypothetical protein
LMIFQDADAGSVGAVCVRALALTVQSACVCWANRRCSYEPEGNAYEHAQLVFAGALAGIIRKALFS